MKTKIVVASLILLPVATVASAQTKVSGTVQCSKPEVEHTIPIGDSPNHSFVINQGKCTWTKPMEIAGTQTKEDVATAFMEVTGNNSRGQGYVVATMANGDKFHARLQESATLKDGVPQKAEGKFSFVRGTGKLKGIKGKGTYKAAAGTEGSMIVEVEGEYELPK